MGAFIFLGAKLFLLSLACWQCRLLTKNKDNLPLKSPFFLASISLLVGILFSFFFRFYAYPCMILSGLFVLMVQLIFFAHHFFFIPLQALVSVGFFLGVLHVAWHKNLMEAAQQYDVITGYIVRTEPYINRLEQRYEVSGGTIFSPLRVFLLYRGRGQFYDGDLVRVTLSKKKNVVVPDNAIVERASYHLSVYNAYEKTVKLLERPGWSLWRAFNRKIHRISEEIRTEVCPKTYKLFLTIFLGVPFQEEIALNPKELFARWGILHLLARSGLHLTIVLSSLEMLCGYFFNPFAQYTIVAMMAFLYYVLSVPSVSFFRALMNFFIVRTGFLLNHRSDSLHAWGITTLFTLLISPRWAASLDFQLSYGVSLALLLCNKFF